MNYVQKYFISLADHASCFLRFSRILRIASFVPLSSSDLLVFLHGGFLSLIP